MASDAEKIDAFIALLEENPNNWIANYLESLLELRQQVGDDDEKNAQAIEEWLQKEEHQELYEQYTKKLASCKRKLSLNEGERGLFGIQPSGKDKSLAESIDQAVKKNTNLGNQENAPSPEQNNDAKQE